MRLIDNWKTELRRLWSIRVAVAWAAFGGLAAGWTALDGVVPTWIFLGGSILFPVILVIARLVKQEGPDEEGNEAGNLGSDCG